MGMFKLVGMTMKSFFKKAPTRKYPYEQREPFERTRGHIEMTDIKSCIFCSICARKCPADAIEVDRKNEVWTIHPYSCVACDACVEACPKKVLAMSNVKTSISLKPEPIVVKRPERTPEELAEIERKKQEKLARQKKAREAAAAKKAAKAKAQNEDKE